MRKHVLPHLTGPIAVWGTLIFAGFLVFEAAISVLNVGIKLPAASWGNLISTNWGTLLVFDPYRFQGVVVAERSNWVAYAPTVALFVTVVALALFGEGLRRAIDPWGTE
jgi:peptide/nickel transport system permease protein